jgi:hypothetical protein
MSAENVPSQDGSGMLRQTLAVLLSFIFVGLIYSSLRRINGDKGTAIAYSSSPTVRFVRRLLPLQETLVLFCVLIFLLVPFISFQIAFFHAMPISHQSVDATR